MLLDLRQQRIVGPFVGAFLIYFQVLLDFSDGALARLQSRPSKLGFEFDVLGCDVARVAVLALLGILTGSRIMILLAVSAGQILTTFRSRAEAALPDTVIFTALRSVTRRAMGDQILVVLLPAGLVTLTLLGIDIRLVATALVMSYSIVSIVWLAASVNR